MTDRTKVPDNWIDRVISVIAGLAPAGAITLDAAARRLARSPRTVQRRMNADGVSFAGLVETTRFQIAHSLLRESEVTVKEIAVRLGYSTLSAFGRAFTKWAGCPPSAYRHSAAGRTDADRDRPEMARRGTPPSRSFYTEHRTPNTEHRPLVAGSRGLPTTRLCRSRKASCCSLR